MINIFECKKQSPERVTNELIQNFHNVLQQVDKSNENYYWIYIPIQYSKYFIRINYQHSLGNKFLYLLRIIFWLLVKIQ